MDPAPTVPYYQAFLRDEFGARARVNPRYSLRAFARAVGIDHSMLSRIVAGKRALSIARATAIADRLGLRGAERRLFLASIVNEKAGATKVRFRVTNTRSAGGSALDRARQVDPDAFAVVSEWYHYAILELTNLARFRPDPEWIADALGIPAATAAEAVERLRRTGHLRQDRRGRLRKSASWFETRDPTRTSEALKAHQAQFLEKSAIALREIPLELRGHYTSACAVDPARLPRAKRLIRRFIEELNEIVTSPDPKEVYWVGISLFPLTRNGKDTRRS